MTMSSSRGGVSSLATTSGSLTLPRANSPPRWAGPSQYLFDSADQTVLHESSSFLALDGTREAEGPRTQPLLQTTGGYAAWFSPSPPGQGLAVRRVTGPSRPPCN